MMANHNQRLEALENAIMPSRPQRSSYICVSDKDWDRLQAGSITLADLGITNQKIYIGLAISPDIWD